MDIKYRDYLAKKEEEATITDNKIEPEIEEDEEITPDVTPFTSTVETPVVEEEPVITPSVEIEEDNLAPTVFEDKEVKEVMPEELPDASSQKGNASAIIISIIAIIIGIVIMFAIIKLK